MPGGRSEYLVVNSGFRINQNRVIQGGTCFRNPQRENPHCGALILGNLYVKNQQIAEARTLSQSESICCLSVGGLENSVAFA
jgi:hypothetical protein